MQLSSLAQLRSPPQLGLQMLLISPVPLGSLTLLGSPTQPYSLAQQCSPPQLGSQMLLVPRPVPLVSLTLIGSLEQLCSPPSM